MHGRKLDIQVKDGTGYTGYFVPSETGKGPGILLIQEIFGVNSHIRDVAELYAASGFNVLAPDVFWRVQPGVELGYSPEDMQKGMALAGKLDQEQALSDLSAAADTLRKQPEFNGKLATVGYCMGGTYAYRLATHDLVDVAVCYYGGNISKYLKEATNLHCPIMLHFGAKDKHIPKSTVEEIRQALQGKGHVELYVYDADHGFNCDQRASYDRRSAMLAFGRTMVLLSRNMS